MTEEVFVVESEKMEIVMDGQMCMIAVIIHQINLIFEPVAGFFLSEKAHPWTSLGFTIFEKKTRTNEDRRVTLLIRPHDWADGYLALTFDEGRTAPYRGSINHPFVSKLTTSGVAFWPFKGSPSLVGVAGNLSFRDINELREKIERFHKEEETRRIRQREFRMGSPT